MVLENLTVTDTETDADSKRFSIHRSKNLFLELFIEFDRFKNNGQLNPGTDENSRVRQMPNGNLFISPVELNDEGVYKCHAANELGEASSTGNLTVLGESLL